VNDEQMEQLRQACVIVGESIAKAVAIVALNLSDMMDYVADHHEIDSIDALRYAIERMNAADDMGDLADDLDDIIPAPKLPRPPKRIGPVNKANYTHNKPQRRARSNCRSVRR